MNTGFHLFPQQASVEATRVDALYLYLVLVTAFFAALICLAILFFAVHYRRGAAVDRTNPRTANLALEAVWFVIPLALVMVMFFWGARLYIDLHQPPAGAREINVVAKQWMWKLQHAGGRAEINALHLPVGRPVKLRMISEDVIHSFFVPAFRTKMDVLPGRYTMTWFQPTKVGTYHLFCAEYCGTSHSQMIGQVIVQEPAAYAEWLQGGASEAPAVAGERLFEQFRCNTCHTATRGARCPPLGGLFGRRVRLRSGATVTADENYIRESIVDPTAKVVAGYEPIMPTFQGQIGEEGILQIIAYVKSLSPEVGPAPPADSPEESRDKGARAADAAQP